MASFLATFAAGVPGRVPDRVPGAENRSGTGSAQGRASQDIEIHVNGAPWWDGSVPADDLATSRADVLAAYRRLGPRLLETARGHFALALIDHSRGLLILGTDRTGVFSLCHARGKVPGSSNDLIVFGTSPRDVANHPAVRAGLSSQALFDYLYFHMVPSPGSVYTGVQKLPGGHQLVHERGRTSVQSYWLPRFARSVDAPAPQLREELVASLRDGVARAMRGTAPLGAFLSGGLDSSSVVGMLAQLSDQPARTFSVGFAAEEYNELAYARIAARRYGADAIEFEVTPAHITEAIPALARAYDEPFGNSSAVPTYWCARTAREHGIGRLLAGDGGDELFGGNKHYSRQAVFELYYRLPALFRSLLCEGLLMGAIPSNAPFPFGKIRSYIEQARIPLPQRLHSWDFMFRTPAATVFDADFLASVHPDHPDELMKPVYEAPETDEFLDRLLYFDWQFVLADNDLRKVNGACALAGVDVRYPMLDTDVIDLSLRLTAEMKVAGQALRPFYKEATRGFLPDEILDKEKHGFGLPFGLWLKSDAGLQDLVFGTVTELKRRKIVRPDFLDAVIGEHRTGHASYYGYIIWDLVMLEQWLSARDRSQASIPDSPSVAQVSGSTT